MKLKMRHLKIDVSREDRFLNFGAICWLFLAALWNKNMLKYSVFARHAEKIANTMMLVIKGKKHGI